MEKDSEGGAREPIQGGIVPLQPPVRNDGKHKQFKSGRHAPKPRTKNLLDRQCHSPFLGEGQNIFAVGYKTNSGRVHGGHYVTLSTR